MHRGYIKLWRCIQDNPMYLEEPFTKGQAWVDLVMLASFKDKRVFIKGQMLDLKRGQLCWSEVKLAERYRWSRCKLRTFLKLLENEQQIIQQKNNVTSWITIVNYDQYQGDDTAEQTPDDTADHTTSRQQTVQQIDTNKNVKNIKNVKNKEEDIASSAKPPKQTPAELIESLKENPAYKHINWEREHGKMDAWLKGPKGKGRKKTYTFVLNWINKIEAPIQEASDDDRFDFLPSHQKA